MTLLVIALALAMIYATAWYIFSGRPDRETKKFERGDWK